MSTTRATHTAIARRPPAARAHDGAPPGPSGAARDAERVFAAAAERAASANAMLGFSRFFTDCLALVAPDVWRTTVRVTAIVTAMVDRLSLQRPWEFEVAARFSQFGRLGLSHEIRAAMDRGDGVSDELALAFASHPLVARDLLECVGPLALVREMIGRQHEPYAVNGPPAGAGRSDRVALGAQLLRIACDADALATSRTRQLPIGGALRARRGEYDPALLEVLDEALAAVGAASVRTGGPSRPLAASQAPVACSASLVRK